MPKASAPKAPWVEVCESPQTMVMPGLVRPSSGPMMWTMPCVGDLHVEELDAELGAVLAQGVRPGAAEIWSTMSRRSATEVVGTLWSTVATVRSGRRTLRPARRRPSNAWGEVTSWTSWRSM